jgi:uncharacterized membrane protein YfcA
MALLIENIPQFVIASLVVVLGAVLQSLSGFGMAILAAPILVLIDPTFLPAPVLALGFALSVLNTLRHRQQCEVKPVSIALATRTLGSILAVLLLPYLPINIVSIIFAVLIILFIGLSYCSVSIKYNNKNLMIGGFFSGLFGTITSIGGPPIAIVFQNSPIVKVRAQLSLFFLVATAISLALLVGVGQFSLHQLSLSLSMLPAIIIGFILSMVVEKHFKGSYLKPAINIASLIASLLIIIKAL